jgi:hypothetical protein
MESELGADKFASKGGNLMVDQREMSKRGVAISELISSEGLHEILTKDGRVVRFFVRSCDHITEEHKRLLVQNAELNISTLRARDQPKMRAHIKDLARELGL